uniref:DUF4283 domain-containing protein n=1 Tax=Chenopodium quinoa TaxID=63459 RepID=A0A803MB58_CHEQI
MWIRVYNLPLNGRLNLANVEKIGNKIGIFVKLDEAAKVGIDKSIRIRALVDVCKPLFKQDYEEYKEHDKSALPYGSWLKASPWKYKPIVAAQVEEVLDKLGEVSLSSVGEGERKNQSKQGVEFFIFKSVEEIGGKKQGEGEESNSSKGIHYKKNWKRFLRDVDHSMEGNVNISGEKRKVVECLNSGSSDKVLENEERNKKRVAAMTDFCVAGPTQRALGAAQGGPWLCGGDLNLMLQSCEKLGGHDFCDEEADILREAVNFCQLEDLGYIGHNYTW